MVSVVIPVYNIAAHLRECLDSVAAQTYKSIEIICVDDGSTDESPKILEEYAVKDSRFYIITQKNAGPGAARNAGMSIAQGKYLIFLDSDDWFEPDFLEKMVAKAEETGADITICRSVCFDTETGAELPSEHMLRTEYLPGDVFAPIDIADYLFQFTHGWPWDKLYQMEFVRENGLTYPYLRNSEDLVFVFDSVAAAKKIAIERAVLVHHRMNRMSSVSNSLCAAPELPYTALTELKKRMETKGTYLLAERSFLNWAMEFLVWNLSNMVDKTAQKSYFHMLSKEWLPELKFESHPRSYYYNKSNYLKYLLARYAPYPVFAAVVNGYKKGKLYVNKNDNLRLFSAD